MSTAASQHQGPGRPLSFSWNRSAPATRTTVGRSSRPRRPAAYAPEALPEHQPSLAALLPTSLGGFAAAATGLLAMLAMTIGAGLWQAVTGGPLMDGGNARFAATLKAALRCLDIHSLESLGGWIAQLSLVSAAITALIVRSLRRHRCDDHRGRFRAWGCLAGLFMMTACAGEVPLGAVFASLVTDATGVTLGPNGMGWWALAAGACYTAVGLWAVLPLYERLATGIWLSACLACWAAAAACGWIGPGLVILPHGFQGIAVNVCWIVGGALAAIAMLAAARSVLREVRGLPTRASNDKPAPRSERATSGGTSTPHRAVVAPPSTIAARAPHQSGESHDRGEAASGQRQGPTEFIDGDTTDADDDSESSGRPLSKAERKRLRKLARMSRAA